MPLQGLRELADLVHQAAAGQVRVVGQRLAAERYLLKHGSPVAARLRKGGKVPFHEGAPQAEPGDPLCEFGAQPLDAGVEFGADRGVELGVRGGAAGHLELVARAEQRAVGQRLAVGVA